MTTIIFIIGVIILVVAFFLTIHSYFWRDRILDWKFLATLLVVGSVLVLSYKFKGISIGAGSSGINISMEQEADTYNNLNSDFAIIAKKLPPKKNTKILQGTAENESLYEKFKKSKDEQERVEMFSKLQRGITSTSTAVTDAIK